MVQVINKFNPLDAISRGIGEFAANQAQYNVTQNRLNKALSNLDVEAKTPFDLAKSLLKATAGLDDQGKVLQALYEPALRQLTSKAEANVDLTGKGKPREVDQKFQRRGNIVSERPEKQELPEFLGKKGFKKQSKFFPTNIGSQEPPGNLPQTATEGAPRPIKTGDELIERSQEILSKWQASGLANKTMEDAYKIAEAENLQNERYNQNVESERQRRIQAQQRYGDLAKDEIKRVLPGVTSEQEAVLMKEAEEAAGRNASEADIKRYSAKAANKLKNTISNIERGLNAPRIQNKLTRSILGKGSTLPQAMKDAKAQIAPLLDLGLYDTARNLLANSNFYPEEREEIVFGKPAAYIEETMQNIPKGKKNRTDQDDTFKQLMGGLPNVPEFSYEPESYDYLRDSIASLFNSPNRQNLDVNLIQLRKLAEDRGYDWRIYKDVLNELFNDGVIDLTDDQLIQLNSYLNEPPLDNIGQILYKLNLRGR